MKRLVLAAFSVGLAALPQPALAGAANFTLVNGTGQPVSNVAIRRTTTTSWTSIPAAPPSFWSYGARIVDAEIALDLALGAALIEVVAGNLRDLVAEVVLVRRDGDVVPAALDR